MELDGAPDSAREHDATDTLGAVLPRPDEIAPGQTFTVTAVPDTIGLGFIELPVATGSSLKVRATFSPDFNGDGILGGRDLAIYLSRWRTPSSDLNSYGLSNSEDLAISLANEG